MAATLIKLIAGNRTREFRPDNIDIIDLADDDNTINISMVSGSVIKFVTPSPTDALAKLALLENAIVSGTGIVTITDSNSAVFTTTTTVPPASTTTTCGPLTIYYNWDTVLDRLDFTIMSSSFTTAVVKDPTGTIISDTDYIIYSVGPDTFIYGITFGEQYGNWTIILGSCEYTVNVSNTTTTTTTIEPTTTTTTEATTTTTADPTTTSTTI